MNLNPFNLSLVYYDHKNKMMRIASGYKKKNQFIKKMDKFKICVKLLVMQFLNFILTNVL